MHGAGNDFILIDEWAQEVIKAEKKEDFVKKACKRRFGVGSDGAIFVQKSDVADVKFVFYNPDGSRAEMCGNGLRCLAKYVFDAGLVKKGNISFETLAGLKHAEVSAIEDSVVEVKVGMGRPQTERGQAQVTGDPLDTFIEQKVEIGGVEYVITSVGMGNPHAVLFMDDIDCIDVRKTGSLIRWHKRVFPNGVNVHFVKRMKDNSFRIRTYERGVEDETLACGTGICASAVAAVLTLRADPSRPVFFSAKGGDVKVRIDGKPPEIRDVFIIGPAEKVFVGRIDLEL